MTRDDIIKAALKAGFQLKNLPDGSQGLRDYVFIFAEILIAAEREECAKVCDLEAARALWNWHNDMPENCIFWNGGERLASSCATGIRARGEK